MRNRDEVKRRMEKMSDWQFYLFCLKIEETSDCPYNAWHWISKNPARFVMYIAFCIGLRPWLWFGVVK